MPYISTAGRSCGVESRESQFLRYFRDTGASKALRSAMLLLYQMPIKPTNVVEFFAEYFENGASDLVHLSLLRSELCYKHSELQDMHKKIKLLETNIQAYESKGFGAKRQSKIINENAGDGSIVGGDPRLAKMSFIEADEKEWMIQRFFGDLMSEEIEQSVTQSVESVSFHPNATDDTDQKGDLVGSLQSVVMDPQPKIAFSVENAVAEAFDETRDPLEVWDQNIQSLDPWGIVCLPVSRLKGFNTRGEMKKSRHKSKSRVFGKSISKLNKSKSVTLGRNKSKSRATMTRNKSRGAIGKSLSRIMSVINSSDDEDEADENYDNNDDAESIAEIYHASAYDPAKTIDHDKHELILSPTETSPKLLAVEIPSRSLLREFLEWSGIPEEARDSVHSLFQSKSTFMPQPRRFSKVELNSNDNCVEEISPCIARANLWLDYGPNYQYLSVVNEAGDAAMLSYEKAMAKLAKKFKERQGKRDDPGFTFEFNEAAKLSHTKICEECGCTCGMVERVDEGTTTEGLNCECGDECECNCDEEDIVMEEAMDEVRNSIRRSSFKSEAEYKKSKAAAVVTSAGRPAPCKRCGRKKKSVSKGGDGEEEEGADIDGMVMGYLLSMRNHINSFY